MIDIEGLRGAIAAAIETLDEVATAGRPPIGDPPSEDDEGDDKNEDEDQEEEGQDEDEDAP